MKQFVYEVSTLLNLIIFSTMIVVVGCEVLVKAPAKKFHYELVIGAAPVACKSMANNQLADCTAYINGVDVPIPNVINPSNYLKFDEKAQ